MRELHCSLFSGVAISFSRNRRSTLKRAVRRSGARDDSEVVEAPLEVMKAQHVPIKEYKKTSSADENK